MTDVKIDTKIHPREVELADYLSNALSAEKRKAVEDHIANCPECLDSIVAAYDTVKSQKKNGSAKKRKADIMKKINLYLVLAIVSFILSFTIPHYFVQFLTATLLLGIKWIVDSKTTRMLVMIYEAWKRGGDKEAQHILETLDAKFKNRL